MRTIDLKKGQIPGVMVSVLKSSKGVTQQREQRLWSLWKQRCYKWDWKRKNFQQADFSLKQGKLSDYELPKDSVETELPSLPRKYALEEIGCEAWQPLVRDIKIGID